MAEETPAPVPPEGAEVKKPARGRPKDDQAPPKPKNGFQQVTGEARKIIKETNPALAMDLKGMADALKEAWEKTPQEKKDKLQKEYEEAMEVWKPKWAAYKETDHYKAFFEVKQDWMDQKTKKKFIKSYQQGKIIEGNVVRVGANFEHAFPEGEESKNYPLKMGQKGTIVAINKNEEGKEESCEIEWDDGKKVFLKKYFRKLEDPDIPKRPKSGYMLFAGEQRDKAAKEVEAEGGGMGDIGKKVSEYWEKTSETKKAEYGERAARMKEEYDKAFLVYRTTDKFKQFENKKVNLESSQKLKKLQRTTMNDAPKRPPSAFSLWKKEAQPALMEKNKQDNITMSMGELGKKLGEMWKEVPDAKKAELEKQCVAMKESWETKHLDFKKNNKYMKFLEERQKVKIRQNRLVNLRDMPKKPKSVFALYAAEHKSEVPQGKGEGKGTAALKQKFVSAPEDEKKKLAAQAKEAEEKWKAELEAFKAGDQFKTFTTTESKVKREFLTEATRVMTIKFINAAPAAPPKSPFSVFLGEKRKAAGGGEGEPKSKEAKLEEVKHFKGLWDKLDKAVKDEYEAARKDKIAAWKVEVQEFMQKEVWQEYLKEAKRLRIPIKQLLQDKKQVKKLKNGMRFIPLPEKPETIPTRPPNAYKLFVREKKQDIDDPEKINNLWKELDSEGKKKYLDEERALKEQFLQEMREFTASDEGRTYFRTQKNVLRSRRLIKAKFDYLKDMPKKPESALQTYLAKNTQKEKKANPEAKGFDIRKKLTDQWLAMSPEERGPLEEEAKKKLDEYTEKMQEFKASENYQKYLKATKTPTKGKGKAKKVLSAGPKAPKRPEEMPKKPRTALQEFAQEEGNAGKDADSLQEAFNELPEDRRTELETNAKAAEEKYQADLFEFNKSEKGIMYNRMVTQFEKKKKQNDLKAKLAKVQPAEVRKPEGMPEKPLSAFRSFCRSQQGTGKDLGALHRAYSELDQEKKQELEAEAKEAEAKYKQDLEDFNKTEAGKKYMKALAIAQKRKTLGEAKVRFLSDQPKKPDGAFRIFCADKQKQVSKDNPDLKGLGAIMGKLSELFRGLSAEEREVYLSKEREAKEEYDKKMSEFERSDDYKRYKAALSRVSGKPSKDKGKGKPSGPPPPVAPADMPKKPPMAFFLFKQEAGRGSPKEQHQQWLDLKAEGQQEWNNKAKEQMEQYEKDMKAFNKTAEGKKYNRLKSGYDRKQAEIKAKERYLVGSNAPQEPKRPMSAYFLFVNAKREGVVKEMGSAKFSEVSAKLTKMWNEVDADEKKTFEKQAAEAKEEYEKALAEYKSSDAVKKFDRAMNALKKPKGKAGPKSAGKGKAAGRGRGGGAAAGKGRGRGGGAAKADGSDSDVMGSDSSNSSSSDSDSD